MHYLITDIKMSYVFSLASISKMVPITDYIIHIPLMMYYIYIYWLSYRFFFCLFVFIGVVKTHICSRSISYVPYDR